MTKFSVASAPDPNHLFTAPNGLLPYDYVAGRTLSNPTVDAQTAVIVIVGQSNAGNFGTGPAYVPTHAASIFNLSLHNGGIYTAAEPLLGNDSQGFGFGIRLADKLITAGLYTKVILCPMAVGGTSVTQWATGPCNHRITAMGSRLAMRGLTPTFVLWHQGESDGGTSQGVYSAMLAKVISDFRAVGVAAPFFVAQVTYPNVNTGVRAAQAAAANGVDVFLGPDTDVLTTGTGHRAVDGVHFNATGHDAHAQLWFDKIDAFLP
jgi:hypothetical protein